jgi:hypothetical protein
MATLWQRRRTLFLGALLKDGVAAFALGMSKAVRDAVRHLRLRLLEVRGAGESGFWREEMGQNHPHEALGVKFAAECAKIARDGL